jgi:hypothetical protein
MLYPELEEAIASILGICGEVYLVGGTIRDSLLNRDNQDIDYVVRQNALQAARKIADHFDGKYYPLDKERGTGRALVEIQGRPMKIDLATMNGANISEDLRMRDFTINAIAQNAADKSTFIDPLGGIEDLRSGRLKPCSPSSFADDPVRTIRAVRFIREFDLVMGPQQVQALKKAIPLLEQVSPERKRDELFHVFEIPQVKESLQLLREYELLPVLLPLVLDLEKVSKNPPHVHNALQHTFQVAAYIQGFLEFIYTEKQVLDIPAMVSAFEMLKDFRQDLKLFLEKPIHPERSYTGLMMMAALYHDIGKTQMSPIINGERVIYPGHAQTSLGQYKKMNSIWALSNTENHFIEKLIGHHMLSKEIMDTTSPDSCRAIYRFYQQAGSAGVLESIFHLADILATYEESLTDARWQRALRTSRTLLEAWFRKHNKLVAPPILVTGNDLIGEFRLEPGKHLGKILGRIREAQAGGEIKDRVSALSYAKKLLDDWDRVTI